MYTGLPGYRWKPELNQSNLLGYSFCLASSFRRRKTPTMRENGIEPDHSTTMRRPANDRGSMSTSHELQQRNASGRWADRYRSTVLMSAAALFAACSGSYFGTGDKAADTPREAADRVVAAIRDRDGATLASFVHPEKNVRFSPSAFVDPDRDRVLTAEQVRNLWTDPTVYRWGTAEGSGEPIELTPARYVSRFVLIETNGFRDATSVSVNDDRAVGTTRNNASEVYENATTVEYYAAGDKAKGGNDWVALRLVFEKSTQRWWLVGVIHDAWSP